jgi:hypothetical protein
VCVAAFGFQPAMHIHHIAICGNPHSTIFFPHYFSNGAILENIN